MPSRVVKEYSEKRVAFAIGGHFVVLNDGFWQTCSALTEGPQPTTSAGAASSECLVRRCRRIEPNDRPGREAVGAPRC